ncbi:hypothetical protein [Novosphingobium sp.]|uniref:hypothetical protein n=1 Tax=Novosphingobium sp. TaxID=1874826 RepID=UPI003B526E47
MDQAVFSDSDTGGETGGALATADRRLSACGETLERMVVTGPSRLLDDETVARVRALTGDLAAQLAGTDRDLANAVHAMLVGNRAILTHCHALAVEWRLAMRLSARLALDPVLPPLVQRHCATMMGLIAAQTRSFEATRRMLLVAGDLPADLQNLAYATVRAARADHALTHLADARADDNGGRLALLHQAVAGLGEDLDHALRVDEAGVSLFFTALAIASGHPRETVVLATAEDDPVRLALLLCATGLPRDDVARQLLALRPDADIALADAAPNAVAAEALLGAVR